MSEKASSLAALRKIVGSGDTRDDGETLGLYAVDGVRPWAVVFPKSLQEVSEVIRLAARENLSVVARGSGSKISRGNVPTRLDLILCTERLNKILDVDTANLTVTAQAGVRFGALQAALAGEENPCAFPNTIPVNLSGEVGCPGRAKMGCFVPLSPLHTRTATLGGIIAADAGGPTRLLYGLPRDLVLGVRYVAPSGEIVGMGGKTVKNVSGYDVCKLMVGSYGGLGVLCEMTLRTLPLPERVVTGLSSFQTLDDAARFAGRIFDSRLLPAAVELMNGRACGLVNAGAHPPRKGMYGVVVAMEGVDEAVGRMNSEVTSWAREAGALETRALHEEAHQGFWEAYSNSASQLSAEYPDMVSVKLNYPVSVYPEIVSFAEASAPVELALFCHAGSGISRIHCLIADKDTDLDERLVVFLRRLLQRCVARGGNMVIEKAPVRLKKRLPVWGEPGGDLAVMKRIKKEMDPLGILSPGRFVGGL